MINNIIFYLIRRRLGRMDLIKLATRSRGRREAYPDHYPNNGA